MDFLSLPIVMIENIVSYLSFDEIAQLRQVSQTFNTIGCHLLNRGFSKIERQHAQALKNVKAQLPRRESERRYHQLSRHCDILTSIETRLSMLNMTYSKYMEQKLCCFIPGKVLDEIRRVLNLIDKETSPPRAHEVLQELRDLSSMAIEHFDDKISPVYRRKLQASLAQPCPPTSSMLAPLAMRQEITNLHHRSALNSKMSIHVAKQYKRIHSAMIVQKLVVCRQDKIIKRMMKRQKEQGAIIADLKKRVDECDIKHSELTQANVGGKTSAGTSDVSSPSSQPLRHFSSQIKLDLSVLPIGTSKNNSNTIHPNMKLRKPVIKLPSLAEMDGETPKIKTEAKKPKSNEIQKMKGMTNEIRQPLKRTRADNGKSGKKLRTE